MNDPKDINPYAPPREVDEFPKFAAGSVSSLRYRNTLRTFRTLMHVLGGFWIVMAIISLLATAFLATGIVDLSDSFGVMIVGIVLFSGMLWFGLGVAVCLKQLWAVYVGLVLSYLSAISNLVQMNMCPLVLIVPFIVVAHFAIMKAGELRRAGIPLTAKAGSLLGSERNPFAGIDMEGIEFED